MSNSAKLPYADVFPVASHIVDVLRPYCDRIEIAGSLRRNRPMVGDIEIVALPRRRRNLLGEPVKIETELDAYLHSKRLMFAKDGDLYKQFVYGRFNVDLFLPASPAHWGAVYTIRTGSHDFNLWVMRERCKRVGIKFEDGRISHFRRGLLETPEEEDVFAALDMPLVPPVDRDDNRWVRYARVTS